MSGDERQEMEHDPGQHQGRDRNDRGIPTVGLLLHPALELFSGAAQHLAADRIDLSVGVKKPTTRSGC
jgi:hypothetical protein